MKLLLFLSIAFFLALTGLLILRMNKKQSGIVIVLNGPSASGKSSIQKEFQKLMLPNLWIKLGIDNLFDAPMPEITLENIDYWQAKNQIRWVENSKDQNNNTIITLFTGEQGEKVAYAMNSAIAAYAQSGCNIIVDYIAYKPEWLSDLRKKLKGTKTIYVAVKIPLEILELREKSRGTSPAGHARSHYYSVYGDGHYDLIVDSHNMSAFEIAQKLKNIAISAT